MKWLEKHRETFISNWFSINGLAFFIVLCLLYLSSFLIKRMLIIDNIAAFEILQEKGDMWVFDLFFSLQYLTVPIFLLWKFTLTALLLWIGCFMFGYRITYSQLWKLVMIFELIFVVPEFMKIIWFTIFQTDPSYFNFTSYYPLSLVIFFDYENLQKMWLYPLKALNLFEVIYWNLLAAGIFWVSKKKWRISLLIVSSSYVLFFFIWLGFYIMTYK